MMTIDFLKRMLVACSVVFAFAACDSDDDDPKPDIYPVEVTSVELNKTSLVLSAGDTVTLVATVLPENGGDRVVTWSSSATDVATVTDGKVTAVAVGSATITARVGEVTAECSVTVSPVEVASIELSETSLELSAGDTVTLVATVLPEDAADKTVTWSSSATDVATVTDGKVTAVAAGSAIITARAGNGIEASCSVVVASAEPNPVPDYSRAAVGDFMLKDGSLLKPADANFQARKGEAIGIVFCTDANRVGAAAREKLGDSVHGLVMALKNAATEAAWQDSFMDAGLPRTISLKSAYEDTDGLGHCEQIWAMGDLQTTHPVFYHARQYNELCPVPADITTGWYLPSMGEWFDILENLGGLSLAEEKQSSEPYAEIGGKGYAIARGISDKMSLAGEGNYDRINCDENSSSWFWTSSECSAGDARYVDFNVRDRIYLKFIYKTYRDDGHRLRCVLAF